MFKLSRKSEYGLIALKYMQNLEAGKLCTAREIAARFKIPEPVMAKILQKLVKSGIVASIQGAYGGYVLAMTPAQITMTKVVEAIEGPFGIVDCVVSGNECECTQYSEGVCNIEEPFTQIQTQFKNFLNGISLADLSKSQTQALPLVQIRV
ncbi:Rrf2 family transcriptional regulator [candidate division KSB1 bacterium]|nr:Rrf2 family transcriptional regulator [candidate division KSB1 bacterium]